MPTTLEACPALAETKATIQSWISEFLPKSEDQESLEIKEHFYFIVDKSENLSDMWENADYRKFGQVLTNLL